LRRLALAVACVWRKKAAGGGSRCAHYAGITHLFVVRGRIFRRQWTWHAHTTPSTTPLHARLPAHHKACPLPNLPACAFTHRTRCHAPPSHTYSPLSWCCGVVVLVLSTMVMCLTDTVVCICCAAARRFAIFYLLFLFVLTLPHIHATPFDFTLLHVPLLLRRWRAGTCAYLTHWCYSPPII